MPWVAAAQKPRDVSTTSFEQLPLFLSLGDRITVTDGAAVRQRRPDSLKNGAGLGFMLGAGAAVALWGDTEAGA